MKIFLDTGDVEAIKRAYDTGLLDGITTNPTHIAKTGRKFQDVVKEICGIVSGPVSVEAMADTAKGLVNEAQNIRVVNLKNSIVNSVLLMNYHLQDPLDGCYLLIIIIQSLFTTEH